MTEHSRTDSYPGHMCQRANGQHECDLHEDHLSRCMCICGKMFGDYGGLTVDDQD